MKLKIILSLLLALGISAKSFAQAEDEATPPPESPKLSGWDEGFWVRSADDKFKLKIGAVFQLAEWVEKKSGLQKLATGSGANRQFTAPDSFSNSFLMRRGNIQLSGTLYEKVDFSAVLNTRTGPTAAPGAGVQTFNFFGDFTVNILPQFRIVGGVIGLPLDLLGEDSSKWFLTTEPPLAATQMDGLKGFTIARQSFGAPPDLGLKLEADLGRYISIAGGVANGPGFQGMNNNNELSFGGRVQINAIGQPFLGDQTDFGWSENPRLMLNVGTLYEDDDTPDLFAPNVTLKWAWTSTSGARFRYRGFSLNAEAYLRYTRGLNIPVNQDTNRDGKLRDQGYYANIGYFVIPHKLELTLTASQILREGQDNDANEFGGSINWYIFKNNVKWQIGYTNVLDYDAVPGLNNATYHRIRTMFSVFL